MSTTPTSSLVELGFFLTVFLVFVPLVFLILFYFYMSQLAGINESLKDIVDMLEERWFPDRYKEEEKNGKR